MAHSANFPGFSDLKLPVMCYVSPLMEMDLGYNLLSTSGYRNILMKVLRVFFQTTFNNPS